MIEAVRAFVTELRSDDPACCDRAALADRFTAVREAKSALAAYEAGLVVTVDRLDDRGLDGAGMLRVEGRMSSKAAARTARTAARLEEMPRAAEALAGGRITAEHAATLAEAAEVVDPQVVDEELVRSAEAAPADVFAKRGREFVNRRRADDEVATELERRHRRRSVKSWTSPDGMGMWLAELDPVSAASVRSALDERYAQLYRDDGGRDGDPDALRTREQRMADAFVGAITGPAPEAGAPHPRHQVTVVVDADRLRADAPAGAAELTDGGPLPQWMLERIACDATFTAVLADGEGRPLWMGRDYRSATIAQWKSLIARDRGCVGCGADPNRCEAHHVVAWIDLGPTDITNLVLLCGRCHHDVHDRGMTLRRRDGAWVIEPRGPDRRPAPLELVTT